MGKSDPEVIGGRSPSDTPESPPRARKANSLPALIGLGRHVAERLDEVPEARLDREAGRARLIVAEIDPRSVRREVRARPRWLAVLAAAAIVGVIGAAIALRPRDAMRFEIGATEPGIVGAWIAAPGLVELPLRFTDGSLVRLAPKSGARVVSMDANGAEIALERGGLELSIVHREHTRWGVSVGPFRIKVVGTRFDVRWDPVSEQLDVALHEGAITISGPVIGDAHVMRAGERLTVSPSTSSLEVTPIDSGAAAATSAPVEPPPIAPTSSARVYEGDPPAPRALRVPEAPPTPSRRAPDWRTLALDAKYKDALAAAEIEGFDALCTSASASDLRALADAARLGGNAARASQAFTALRTRFPGSAEAAAAAFILGRTAQDQRHDYAAAARWFTTYLAEQPRGAFSADASGRLVEARDHMGDEAGARLAAERYLAAYPNGSHAGYARRVIDRGSSASP